MARLIVRGLDERLVAALKARAARDGRSAEAGRRRILEAALAGDAAEAAEPDMVAFAEAAARLRARFPSTADGAQVIREARDARHG